MKCRNCGKELPENANVCPDCGTEAAGSGVKLGGDLNGFFRNQQNGDDQQGIEGSLPPQGGSAAETMNAEDVSTPAKKSKKEAAKSKKAEQQPEEGAATEIAAETIVSEPTGAETEQTEIKETDLGDMVKNFGKKAGDAAKKLGGKAAGVAKTAAVKVSDIAGETGEQAKNKGGLKTILITIAAVVVLVLIIAGVLAIPGGDDEDEYYALGAVIDEELYILDGDKLTPLYDDLPDDIDYYSLSSMLATFDYKSYYLISDVETDEDTNYQTGDLILIGKNGKYEDIDKDVIVGSMQTVGKILWYARLDKDEVTLCSCNGIKVTEIGENIDYGQGYIGLPDAKKAYFNTIDKEKSIACFAQSGKVEELADDVYIIGASDDYKKLLWADEDGDLYIFDGKNDKRIMKSVDSVVYDPKTMDCLVVDDDGELSYIPYGKDPVDIDDDVESVLVFAQGYIYPASVDSAEFTSSGYIYYNKKGDLYKADLKGKSQEKIIKNFYDDVYYSWVTVDNGAIYWADDDEINLYELKSGKEDSYKLDAEDLSYANLSYYDGMFLFINEDDELMAAKYGDKKPQLINDDAEDIQYFYYLDKKVYYVDDGDLYVSPLKENAGERLVKDFSEFEFAFDETLYVIADADEDGGDLYLITKNGKAKEIESDVQYVFYIG